MNNLNLLFGVVYWQADPTQNCIHLSRIPNFTNFLIRNQWFQLVFRGSRYNVYIIYTCCLYLITDIDCIHFCCTSTCCRMSQTRITHPIKSRWCHLLDPHKSNPTNEHQNTKKNRHAARPRLDQAQISLENLHRGEHTSQTCGISRRRRRRHRLLAARNRGQCSHEQHTRMRSTLVCIRNYEMKLISAVKYLLVHILAPQPRIHICEHQNTFIMVSLRRRSMTYTFHAVGESSLQNRFHLRAHRFVDAYPVISFVFVCVLGFVEPMLSSAPVHYVCDVSIRFAAAAAAAAWRSVARLYKPTSTDGCPVFRPVCVYEFSDVHELYSI